MVRLYEEVPVIPAKRPNPLMAYDIINTAKTRDSNRMIIEVLFDPEAKAFKILCEASNAAAARALLQKVIVEKKERNEAGFLSHQSKLRVHEYDRVRFPEAFVAKSFRAIVRLSDDPSTPGTLAEVMSSCGYDDTQTGCEIFEKRTKVLISCNITGTTIYLGANTEADLKVAMCVIQFFSDSPMKSNRTSSGSPAVAASGIRGFSQNMSNEVAAAIQLWVRNVESHRNPNSANAMRTGRARGRGTATTPGPGRGWRTLEKDRSDRMPIRRSAPVARPPADGGMDLQNMEKLIDAPDPEYPLESFDCGQIPNLMDM